jgi:hypothetical protein
MATKEIETAVHDWLINNIITKNSWTFTVNRSDFEKAEVILDIDWKALARELVNDVVQPAIDAAVNEAMEET